jgi:hypothetical protein
MTYYFGYAHVAIMTPNSHKVLTVIVKKHGERTTAVHRIDVSMVIALQEKV